MHNPNSKYESPDNRRLMDKVLYDLDLFVLPDLKAEITRAGIKHGWENTPANPAMFDEYKYIVLSEEVGEVAHELTYDSEGTKETLKAELLQVAAMALTWAVALEDAPPMYGLLDEVRDAPKIAHNDPRLEEFNPTEGN